MFEETIIYEEDLLSWLAEYEHTGRTLFIHPIDLEYEDKYNEGKIHSPLKMTQLNVDTPKITIAKKQFFHSITFSELTKEQKEERCRLIGIPKVLLEQLRSRNDFKGLNL